MRCEIVAVGTELLLGQVVDTNSAWLGEHLAMAGIDSHFQTKVGDNLDRVVSVLRLALDRSEAVIVCGGLGPTQDDLTREAIAEVMGVELVRDETVVDFIRQLFGSRARAMPENNLRQADVPVGATVIPQVMGTAPGLICPVGDKVIYAVPGVPYEMEEMVNRAVLPDLQTRAGVQAVIASRTLRTWGQSESGLAEMVAARVVALDETGNPTLAFLASGIEGIKIRITAKAEDAATAASILDEEEGQLRKLLGPLVFGVDDETMEQAVATLLLERGMTLGLAESLTGGLVGSRITAVPGATGFFLGSIVSYAGDLKHRLLGVPEGPVVSAEAAIAMAEGARRVLGSDVGLSTTGVAGPTEQDGQPVGTVFFGVAMGGESDAVHVRFPGDRDRVRQFAAISVLDMLRHRLLASD